MIITIINLTVMTVNHVVLKVVAHITICVRVKEPVKDGACANLSGAGFTEIFTHGKIESLDEVVKVYKDTAMKSAFSG